MTQGRMSLWAILSVAIISVAIIFTGLAYLRTYCLLSKPNLDTAIFMALPISIFTQRNFLKSPKLLSKYFNLNKYLLLTNLTVILF